jgi:hypothetical protein
MSRDSDYRREMGMDMPVPARDYASERYTVTSKSNEPAKRLNYGFVAGVMMVEDEGGWRPATEAEYKQIMGGVACMPSGCCEEGEL